MGRRPNIAAGTEVFDFDAPSCQTFNDFETFARFCEQYPNQTATVSYVYRLWPVIDREQTGTKESCIEKLTGQAPTYDWLSRTWGSGRYMLCFVDANRKNNQRVAKCSKVVIDDPTLPPVLNPAELVCVGKDGESNAAVVSKYLQMGWTVMEASNELKPNGFKQLAPPNSAPSSSADKVLADAVASIALQAQSQSAVPANSVVIDREMFRELMAARKSGGVADDFDRILAAAKALQPPQDQTTAVLLGKMADALLRRSTEAAAAPVAADPVAQLRATMQFMREEMGFGAPSRNSGGGAGFLDALVALPGILQHGASFLGQLLAMRMMQTAAPGAPGLPFPVPSSVPPASAAMPAAPTPEVAAQPAAEDPMVNPLKLQALIQVGQDAIAAFESGMSGDDFAEKLCQNQKTEETYDDLLAMGKAQIMNAFSLVPGLAEKLAPKQAAIEAWIDQFLAYGADESQMR